jgi:acetyl-CoA carboxylase biotin carboxyl carrier protein
MDLEKVERLLEIVARSGMAEVEVEEEGFRLFVRATAPASAPPPMMAFPPPMPAPMPGYPAPGYPAAPSGGNAPAPAPEAGASAAASAEPGKGANEQIVQAPIVGTFYASPAPDADPFVKVGDRVEVGTVLCIIEAMKLMNEIQSEHAGVVKQVLVQNAQPVEYDQPLFVIEQA